MKRSFFLNKIALLCSFLFIVGCSSDAIVNEENIPEADAKKGIRGADTMEVLIEFVKGTPENRKQDIRNNYIKTGLLLEWKKCKIKNNDDVEVWLIDFPLYVAFRPAPFTDPDKEDMDKVTLNANCKDYKENYKED